MHLNGDVVEGEKGGEYREKSLCASVCVCEEKRRGLAQGFFLPPAMTYQGG